MTAWRTLACLLVLLTGLAAEKPLATFTEPTRPGSLEVGGEYIYVGDFPTVFVYSRKDGRLITRFGKEGEGPGEFAAYLLMRVSGDRLLINSQGKLSFYSLTGEYREEKRVNPREVRNLLPLGRDRYVALGRDVQEDRLFVTVNLLDKQLHPLTELGRQLSGVRGEKIHILDRQTAYETDGERIYLMMGAEFVIQVFDREGKKRSTITRDYKRVKFSAADREMVLGEFRENPRIKPYFEMFKERVEFPEYWPAVATVFPRGGRLYVLTFKREKETRELFILTPAGELIRRLMVPLRFRTSLQPYPTDIRDGKLYQLVKNRNDEWELHAWPL